MSRRYYEAIGPVARLWGKDVFLTKHAKNKIRERSITVKKILEILMKPTEKFLDKTAEAKIPKGFKRYAYTKHEGKKYIIVVADIDHSVIIVTTFKIHGEKKYERHKKSKIRKKEWIPV